MKHDKDEQDKRDAQRERITLAQDGYPQSWSFGAFGKEYRRTWFGRKNNSVPKFEKD